MSMDIVKAILADTQNMPPITAMGYEYLVAGNGLFIRAENARLEACVPVATARLYRLPGVEPFAHLKVPRVPYQLLWRIFHDARRQLPNEAMYQFVRGNHAWSLYRPNQKQAIFSLSFDDEAEAVIDLHSHGSLGAFFSNTDDADEQGLRFYAVIGHVDDDMPEIRCRVGVYGHHWNVPANTVFDGLGRFRDEFGSFDGKEYLDLALATVNG